MSEFDDDSLQDEHIMYEVVKLADGDIGLCRAGDEAHDYDPLVRIRFSDESQYFLEHPKGNVQMAVAKAMIEAGLEAVQEIQSRAENESAQEQGATLHWLILPAHSNMYHRAAG